MKEGWTEDEEEEEEGGWAGRRCLTSCPPMLISHGLNRQHKGEKEKDFDMRGSNATHTNIESQRGRGGKGITHASLSPHRPTLLNSDRKKKKKSILTIYGGN